MVLPEIKAAVAPPFMPPLTSGTGVPAVELVGS
jgi:hypothetical protein